MAKKPKPPTGATPMEKFLVLFSPGDYDTVKNLGERDTLAQAQTVMNQFIATDAGVHKVWIVKTVDRGNV